MVDTWTGGSTLDPTNYQDAANWSENAVPAEGGDYDVVFPVLTGKPYTVDVHTIYTINSFTTATNVTLDVQAGTNFEAGGTGFAPVDIINNGTLLVSGAGAGAYLGQNVYNYGLMQVDGGTPAGSSITIAGNATNSIFVNKGTVDLNGPYAQLFIGGIGGTVESIDNEGVIEATGGGTPGYGLWISGVVTNNGGPGPATVRRLQCDHNRGPGRRFPRRDLHAADHA
jgi:hypothetical protein